MKAYPLISLGFVSVVFFSAFWSIHHLAINSHALQTQLSADQSLATAPSPTPLNRTALRATLLLHAFPMPNRCQVIQNGRIILTEKNLIAPGEYRAPMELVKGMNLVIRATWGNEEPHAIRAEVLIHGYQQTLEKSFWAQETLEDTISIPSSFLP